MFSNVVRAVLLEGSRLLLSNKNISIFFRVLLQCTHYNLRTYRRTSQSRLSIDFIELQSRAALATHHYTEDVFQSILHCYRIRGLRTQSGCTQCHRKSDRYVLGNYYTALNFRGKGLSIDDSSSLFHEKKLHNLYY